MKQTQRILLALMLGLLMVLLGAPATTHAGTPVGGQFVISSRSEVEKNPAIAYNSQNQEYLVVWRSDRPGNDDIYAQRVSMDGAPIGSWFAVGWWDSEKRNPAVAYYSQANEYLVVWE